MSTKRVLLLRPFPESPPPEAGAQWTLEAVGSIPWLSVDGMENLPQRSRSFPTSRPNRLPWCMWACTARGALGSVGLGPWSQNAQLLIQAGTVLVSPSLHDLPMGNAIDVDAGERDDLLGGGETEE